MTPERWRKIEEIFHLVAAAEPAAQAALLARHCGGDEDLRREIEVLLGSTSADEFLQAPIKEVAQSLPQASAANLSGQDLGAYRVVEQIGKGGMGIVYRARDTRLSRTVALKLLPPELVYDTARVRRFRQEARAISTLNHPNILTIYEIGEAPTDHGTAHFIATEFVEGRTLRAVLQESDLTLGMALDALMQTAEALAAAHRAGVVHRDIKPENIMVRPDGVVKVLDFGLAKFTTRSATAVFSTAHTDPGLVMGTVNYMSPEQVRGQDVDARTDIFSLGVVAYELLTGFAPFTGETNVDVLAAILHRDPPALKQANAALPNALQTIVSRALAKDCAQRFQRVDELHDSLKTLQQELILAGQLKRAGRAPADYVSLKMPLRPDASKNAIGPSGKAQRSSADVRTAVLKRITQRIWPLRFSPSLMLWLGLLLGGLAIAGYLLYRRVPAEETSDIRSIAVLPFFNIGNDPEAEYLSDGITESLMQSLQQAPGLRVMARGTVYSYKGREVDPRQIGQALQVQAVVIGRVQKRGEQLTLWVELADAHNGARLWGVNYQRSMKDLAATQTELTQVLSTQLAQRFGAQTPRPVTPQQSQNAEAYRLYLLGNYHAHKQGREDGLKALDYYQQAIALDPAYALAHTGIADVYAFFSSRYLTPQEAMPKARQAALKALELNPALAEAHQSLAIIKCWGDWDWAGAEQEFKRALELNPNLAIAHALYANTLSFQRRFAEFHREIALAQQLDPLSALALEMNVWGLYFERRYDDALAESQKLLSLAPTYYRAHSHRSLIYRQKGQLREAIAEAQRGLALERNVPQLSTLAYLYAVAGQPENARKLLAELEQTARQRIISPYVLAKIHIGLGEPERALARLQETYDAHSEFLFSIGVDPIFDPLRADPRFQKLVRDVGLYP